MIGLGAVEVIPENENRLFTKIILERCTFGDFDNNCIALPENIKASDVVKTLDKIYNSKEDGLQICEREAYKQAAIKLVNELFSFSITFIVQEKDKVENVFNKHWDKFCDEQFENFG